MSEPYVFEHGGKRYVVSRLTREKKKAFAASMKTRALKAVLGLKDIVSDEEYAAAYNAALERVASGAFDFHSTFTQQALRTPGGVTALAAILFGCDEDEMTKLFVERRDDVKVMLDVALKESSAELTASNPTEAV